MDIFDAIANKNVSVANNQVKSTPKQVQQTKLEYKPDILDICSEKVINKRDITDTVTMPRAIFKGYLCFTAGTAINAISGMLQKNTFSKALGIIGSLISIYGTFNFVKPFLIPEKQLTNAEK